MRNRMSSFALVLVIIMLMIPTLSACAPVAQPPAAEPTAEAEAPAAPEQEATAAPEEPTAAPAEGEPKYGGVLKYGDFQTSMTINPWQGRIANTDMVIAQQIYESLVILDPSWNIQPLLATSWEATTDTEYIFHLREGVLFHNGEEMTADDVVYSIERLMNPDISVWASELVAIDTVEAVDDYTVKISLKEPFSPLLTNLASEKMAIVPEGTIEEDPFPYIGTGPFMVEEYVPGSTAELVRFDDYWEEGVPYLDGISYVFLPDEATRVANLVAGEVDMINYVPGQSWAELQQNPDITLYSGPSGIYYYAIFNTNVPPFDDPNVRKALQWIPDREAMCEIVYSGLCWAIPGDPQPPDSQLYSGIETFTAPDLEKAREYLAQSNYPDGFEAEMGFYGGAQDEGQMAEIFQANAAELGITFNVRAVDEAVWREKVWAGDFTSLVTGRGGYDPDGFFFELIHPDGGSKWNTPGYDNPEVNALLEQARAVVDPAERQALYKQALEVLYEDGWPLAYLVATLERTASRSDVMGYVADGQGLARWLKYTWLDR